MGRGGGRGWCWADRRAGGAPFEVDRSGGFVPRLGGGVVVPVVGRMWWVAVDGRGGIEVEEVRVKCRVRSTETHGRALGVDIGGKLTEM